MNPTDFTPSLYPSLVDYRQLVGQGIRVVIVHLHGAEPRISAFSERFGPSGREFSPMSLSLTEIEDFVHDARRRLGV